MANASSFTPDWVSPPGRTIKELLRHREITNEDFASQISLYGEDLDHLLAGKTPINVDIAGRLEKVVGGTVEFWITRDFQYRADAKRLFGTDSEWLNTLPYSDMRRFGWLGSPPSPPDEAKRCLDFFGVDSVESWHEEYGYLRETVLFRKSESFDLRPGSVAAWLRKGELDATGIMCSDWSVEKFERSVCDIRKLTRKKHPRLFLPKLREICSDCGVALVIARTPSGCPASGATRFLTKNKAMLLLSFRHMSDDHFWFSFFHEAGHLILHRPESFLVEGVGDQTNALEEEANRFAQDMIVPPHHCDELLALRSRSIDIIRFAKKIGVSPGLIVGQLQHREVLGFNQQNRLKQRYDWADLIPEKP